MLEAVGVTDSCVGPEPLDAVASDEVVESCWLELGLELESVVEEAEADKEAVLEEMVTWLDEVVESELNVDEDGVVETTPSATSGVLLLLVDEVVVVKSDALSSDELDSVVEVLCVRCVVAGVLELVKT